MHRAWQGSKRVTQQHQIGGTAGHLTATLHGDAQVGAFEGEHIVETVAHHRDIGTLRAQFLHDALFLLRGDPSKDRGVAHHLGELCRFHF